MYKKVIKLFFLILWMIVIFMFSAQPHSGSVTHSILVDIFPMIQDNYTIDVLNFIIRKSAHFTVYFILTFFCYSFLKEYFYKVRWQLFFSVLFCFVYSLTDEFHQYFVPGRTSSIKDCFIDTCGGLFFVFLFLIFHYFCKKKKKL